jgi:hypothetical protein
MLANRKLLFKLLILLKLPIKITNCNRNQLKIKKRK